MSRTVYLAHNAQILAALSDNEYSDGKPRCRGDLVSIAPYYANRPLRDWELDALHVFSDLVLDIHLDGYFEYNGSSSCEPDERQDSWVVAVYESPVPDFAGDQLDALTEHPATVLHGYVEFVDQQVRYSGALLDLDALVDPDGWCAGGVSKAEIVAAVGEVFAQCREHHDPVSDIVEGLRGTAWDYVDGDLVRRIPEAA